MYDILLASAKVSLVYCICCFLFHYVVKTIARSTIGKSLTKKSQRIWNNKAVSIVHAIIMFSLVMHYWIFVNPTMELPNKVGIHEARCLDIMMGYLWYDSIYEIMSDGQIDTLGHHILGLISHLSSRLSDHGALGFYSMLVYVAEGSTPALHMCWLLHQLKLKDTWGFKVLVIYLLCAFFVFRILLSPYMLWHMLTFKDTWEEGMSFELFWGNWLIVFLFALLNYFWFYKLTSLALKA